MLFRMIVATSLLLSGAAHAADITWSAPVNASGNASDVLLTGNLHAASTSGQATTLNGVSFGSYGGMISLVGVYAFDNIYSTPNFSDAAYNRLVGAGASGAATNPFSIRLSGLTFGNSYAVQLWQPFWNGNWATRFTGGANTSGLVNLTGSNLGAGASSVPQFVIGTFTADNATQSITLSSPTQVVLVGAVQVRDVTPMPAVPEPDTWAMLIAGFGLVGGAARRRRPIAA